MKQAEDEITALKQYMLMESPVKKLNFTTEATAKQTTEGFVVLKGSKIAPSSGADDVQINRAYDTLEAGKQGVLHQDKQMWSISVKYD